MPRFSAAVHLTNPKSRTREFFLKGQEIPEWAHAQIGEHLIAKIDVEAVAAKVAAAVVKLPETIESVTQEAIVSEPIVTVTEVSANAVEDEDEDDEDSEDDAVAEGYAGWTNSALRDELVARSLPITGKKDDLIARLLEDDA